VHVVVLIGRDPVVVRYGVIRQISKQLLQRSILLRQWIGRGGVIATIAVAEKHLRGLCLAA